MAYVDDLLAENERILLSARRHVIFVILQLLPWVFGALVLWFLIFATYSWEPPGQNILVLVLLVGSLALLAVGGWKVFVWSSESYYVTTFRIVQVEGIFTKRTYETSLEKVNDVQMHQSVLGRLFDFATINIITGSDLGVNELRGISRPAHFKRIMLQTKLRLSDDGQPRWTSDPSLAQSTQPVAQAVHAPAASAAPAAATQAPVTTPPTTATDDSESARAVIALTELRNSGVLSDQEFNDKLQQILKRPG